MEGTANSGTIPYFTKYFHEYAEFDLKTRYGLPFESLYGVDYGQQRIRYPDERTMIVPHQGKEYRVRDYVAAGGNVHFPPNARGHYDQDNPRRSSPPSRTGGSAAAPTAATGPGRSGAACWTAIGTSLPTAWAPGSSTGGRTCPAGTIARRTTPVAR
jgi:hypothetical protein